MATSFFALEHKMAASDRQGNSLHDRHTPQPLFTLCLPQTPHEICFEEVLASSSSPPHNRTLPMLAHLASLSFTLSTLGPAVMVPFGCPTGSVTAISPCHQIVCSPR
mmetsp:Transcript_27899/g.75393  ORF Transcript_27899/g.75393 Transcript_27899/m.75393 type:complete len:107 (-) Transcript_27899:2989-3309(-)